MNYQKIESPAGDLYLVADGEQLAALIFAGGWPAFRARLGNPVAAESPVLRETERQLREYFAGQRREFDLPLKLTGTEFQKQAWLALAKIPYGQTRSYREQATS